MRRKTKTEMMMVLMMKNKVVRAQFFLIYKTLNSSAHNLLLLKEKNQNVRLCNVRFCTIQVHFLIVVFLFQTFNRF